jgi:hypothetical protein
MECYEGNDMDDGDGWRLAIGGGHGGAGSY